jgi:hypothetical protein
MRGRRPFRVPALFCFSLGLLAVGACDSSGEQPTPPSVFNEEHPLARQLFGRVVRGTEVVPGAIVQLEPSPGFARDERLRDAGDPATVTSTDLGGKYFNPSGPLFYDLSVRKDREVAVFRNLGTRYFEPAFAGDARPVGFTSTVTAATKPVPAPGNAVAFFVTGADARTVSGDASSLVLTFRRFETVVTLHAVEYVASGGLAAVTRMGKTDIHVTNGAASSATVSTSEINEAIDNVDVRFVAVPPVGFALSLVDVVMDFGLRTSARPVARVAAGTPLHLRIARGARYFARATATQGGATSDTGLQGIDVFQKDTVLSLPPPVTEATFDGGGELTALTQTGVVEHVLVPSGGGGSIRIATAERVTTLPDLTRLGLARATGPHTWTVHHFPTVGRIDVFSGEDVRIVAPFSTSVPHVIALP